MFIAGGSATKTVWGRCGIAMGRLVWPHSSFDRHTLRKHERSKTALTDIKIDLRLVEGIVRVERARSRTPRSRSPVLLSPTIPSLFFNAHQRSIPLPRVTLPISSSTRSKLFCRGTRTRSAPMEGGFHSHRHYCTMSEDVGIRMLLW